MDHPATTSSDDQPALHLVCQEIWGGNRHAATPVRLPGIRGWLHSRPSNSGAGGDLHYLSVCGSGMLSRVCLADVAGHGDAVAATSTVMHQHLRRAVNRTDQRRVLRDLNRLLVRDAVTEMATMAMLSYFPPTRRLTYSYAGHEPAWHFERERKRWQRLRPNARQGLVDLPLAVDGATRFDQVRRRVAWGDRVLLLTDGVLEAAAPDGTLFGAERLTALLEDHREADCQELISMIVAAVTDHSAGSTAVPDDVSLVLLEFVRDDNIPALWRAIWNRLTRPRGNSDRHSGVAVADRS